MNSYGTLFKVTLYGESHQEAIGIVIDGMPSGIKIDENKIREEASSSLKILLDERSVLIKTFSEKSSHRLSCSNCCGV